MEPAPENTYQNKKILIIDDEPILGISCKRILEQLNFTAVYRDRSKQGLEDALSGEYDLILLDLLMPELDGMEVLRRLKAAKIETDIIIITGYGTIQTAVEAMKLGACDYVNKPFTPDELKIIVRRVFQHSELVKENISLKKELSIHRSFKGIVYDSMKMKEILSLVQTIAPTNGTVCISGESGTGKEVVAKIIHELSSRSDKPLITCDCSALVSTLLESELFGHVKGSFTGAVAEKQGIFEAAHKGTLFLDEISNISMETQAKLLRVLETRELRKVGDTKERKIDVRLITATNRDLTELVKEGKFREDLFYRLKVIPINLPPLRKRPEDILKLSVHFLDDVKKKNEIKAEQFAPETIRIFEHYNWPGNIRELKNIIERISLLCDSKVIQPHHVPQEITSSSKQPDAVILPDNWEEFKIYKRDVQNNLIARLEQKFVQEALKRADGNITKAAKEVGMQRTNFHQLIQKYRSELLQDED